ncbi:hypothetical protein HG531_013522 [Fusarium graminearum]|nr:hypothetical protein HG531_013522 [Fusarium graminearum]
MYGMPVNSKPLSEVGALADDETAILVSVGEDVDETLQAAETRLERILILVGPGLVELHVFAVGEGSVDGVKRDDEILCVVDLLKGFDNAWFLTDAPGEALMSNTIADDHALFSDYGQSLILNSARIIALKAHTTVANKMLVIEYIKAVLEVLTSSQEKTSSLLHTGQLVP